MKDHMPPAIQEDLRIAVLGSSVSIQKKGYLPAMASQLESRGYKVRILNASLGGCSTEATLAYLSGNLFYDLKSFNPNIAIIEKGANERDNRFSKMTLNERSILEDRIRSNTKEVAIAASSLGACPILLSSYFKETKDYLHNSDAPAGYIARAYKAVADELGLLHIDVANSISKILDHNTCIEDLLLDDVHLTPKSADTIGKYVAKIIQEFICLGEDRNALINGQAAVRNRIAIRPEGGDKKTFETSLTRAEYYTFFPDEEYCIPISNEKHDSPCLVSGIFVISDPHSGWLRLKSDTGSRRDICLFDHMSFYQRIHYIPISPPLPAKSEIKLEVLPKPVNLDRAIKSFKGSKTFNPSENWAQEKFLKPLLEVHANNSLRNCKVIAIISEELQALRIINENKASFYSSNENVFGLEEGKHGVVTVDNARIVGGIGAHGNSHIITNSEYKILPECATENVLWRDQCLHRIKETNAQKLEIGKRIAALQYELIQAKYLIDSENVTPIEITGPSIWLGHAFGWYAYGHLFDSLQRLYYLQKQLNGLEYFNIFVSRSNRIKDFDLHVKCLLGKENFEKARIIELGKKKIYVVQMLIYPQTPATLTSFTQATYDWAIQQYKSLFADKYETHQNLNLYLSRNHIRPGVRGVNNEKEILTALQTNNFIIVDGSEDLSTIYRLFSNAKLVIGPHGSLFANTIFCPPEASIIEFCPSNRIDTTFARKYKLCKQYYQYVTVGDSNFNINIDFSVVNAFL